ncbi:ABC transporter substrate-binding protein [Leucobacter denitrificans]|uniref:ABC transporter substrate-binding protein n=1 Tax=Leucobacter denitrificans TaxID=683042 RepID=UPI003624657F
MTHKRRIASILELDRRGFIKAGLAGAAGLTLSACTSGAGEKSITWGNWPYLLDYDPDAQTYPTLDEFIAESGISVRYLEDIDDNNTFFAKIKDQLSLNDFTGYDVITFTDWMNARIIESGSVQQFDRTNIPLVYENTIDLFKSIIPNDPNRDFSVPWDAAGCGLVWNTELVPGGVHTLDDLLAPELKGRVGLLSEWRFTMGVIMSGQGVDISGEWGDPEYERALEWLDRAISDGHIANLLGNSYTIELERDNLLASLGWSGDIAIMNAELGDRWTYEVPEFGAPFASDSLTIPNGTPEERKEWVEELANFYFDPTVAAHVAAYVGGITPVRGAQEAMEKVDPTQVENSSIFPDETIVSRLKSYRRISDEEDVKYTTSFNKLLGL